MIAFRHTFRVALLLGLIGSLPGQAQEPAPSNVATSLASKVPPPPVPPPPDKAPVARFRELLAMPSVERQAFLAQKPPEARKLIEQKLQEYNALSPEECELRLRVTELRYYLLAFMTRAPASREPQLNLVPDELRPMIELRLKNWDELPGEKQRELLENEKAVRYLLEVASAPSTRNTLALTNMPPEQKTALLESIEKWNRLAPSERSAIVNRFEQFFGLNPREKQETLSRLSPQERHQIDKTLQTLTKLEPAKRAQCIRALNKLTGLPPAEQQAFLKNAERWKALTAEQRKAWRNLVVNLSRQPPLPPGAGRPAYPPIPPPPLPGPAPGSQKIATNQ